SKDDSESEDAKGAVIDVFPEEKVQAAGSLISQVFGDEKANPDRKEGGDASAPVTTSDLPKLLDSVLEAPRNEWPTGLCRRMWEFLEEHAAGRGKSPAHLARWYNLTGYVLRPGFGDPVDRYRVESLWKLITAAASGTAAKKTAVPEGGADYWIMWRRVSGGWEGAALQQMVLRLEHGLVSLESEDRSCPPAPALPA